MLVGHLALAFAIKPTRPAISLGTLMLAVLLADFVAFALMIAGVEGFTIVAPGKPITTALAVNLRYSHSLLVDAILAALFAGAYLARDGDSQGASWLAAAVLSHWPLDVISHAPDMPLAPWAHARFGLGLWSSVPATVIVEGTPWLLAVLFYVRATRARNRAGVFAFWPVVLFLTLAWFSNFTAPPPPGPRTMGITSGIFFSLVVAWAYWMNPLRPPEVLRLL